MRRRPLFARLALLAALSASIATSPVESPAPEPVPAWDASGSSDEQDLLLLEGENVLFHVTASFVVPSPGAPGYGELAAYVTMDAADVPGSALAQWEDAAGTALAPATPLAAGRLGVVVLANPFLGCVEAGPCSAEAWLRITATEGDGSGTWYASASAESEVYDETGAEGRIALTVELVAE